MDLNISPGKYILAVSGGVDSVALLNMLSKQQQVHLVVAHFNHGIRKDSIIDEKFVRELANSYGCVFVSKRGHLGAKASEEQARKARYKFLNLVKDEYRAKAIITAHHQDDVIETAVINLLRGTGRKGLSSLKSSNNIARPLIHISKAQIIDYAQKNNLHWLEDPTNKDPKYLRNWARLNIMPKINDQPEQREKLVKLITENRKINEYINPQIATISQKLISSTSNRKEFIMMPDDISKEVLIGILTTYKINDINNKMVELMVAYIKTGAPKTSFDIKSGYTLNIEKDKFWISSPKELAPLI